MVELIFMLSFGLSLITIMLAILSNWKWYWVAGLCVYIFSFLGSWSFVGYPLSVAFVLWALAIGHSLKLVTKFHHSVIAVIISLILCYVMINTFGYYWLFLPLFSMFS